MAGAAEQGRTSAHRALQSRFLTSPAWQKPLWRGSFPLLGLLLAPLPHSRLLEASCSKSHSTLFGTELLTTSLPRSLLCFLVPSSCCVSGEQQSCGGQDAWGGKGQPENLTGLSGHHLPGFGSSSNTISLLQSREQSLTTGYIHAAPPRDSRFIQLPLPSAKLVCTGSVCKDQSHQHLLLFCFSSGFHKLVP